jgi:Mg-chelatase subunit ChlD
MGLLMALPALLGCPASGPGISVYPMAFNFGTTATKDAFTVSSRGSAPVAWHIENLPAWAQVDIDSGNAGPGGQLVNLTIDRNALSVGDNQGEFQVVSGDTPITVALHAQMQAPPLPPVLSIDPTYLDFGSTSLTKTLAVRNIGDGKADWTVKSDDTWASVSPAAGSEASGAAATNLTVTVNRGSLDEGIHNTNLHFTFKDAEIVIPVTLSIPQKTPQLTVGATTVNFGPSATTRTLSLGNTGLADLNWQVESKDTHLAVSTTNGLLPPGTTIPLTLTIDRTGLDVGNYSTTLDFTSTNGGSAHVTVNYSVAAPKLVVTPTTLNFGSYLTTKLLTVGNSGSGSLAWTIDTSAFPTWLKLSSDNGSAGPDSNAIIVTCDRTNLTSGSYTHKFTVRVSDTEKIDVTVNMSTAPTPAMTVQTGFLNNDDEPLVPMGTEATEYIFTISNTGTGTLDWNLDGSELPEWLIIKPLTGSLLAGQISTVHVTVDRSELPSGGYIYKVPLDSNATDTQLEVTMEVPLRPSIGLDPEQLKLGLDSDIGACYVANMGDANTLLNYVVTSDKDWLFFSPATNTSIGTPGEIKDWKRINVAVDRSMLENGGGTATLTITPVDGAGKPLRDLAPRQIKVSVESPTLSFEAALAKTFAPSQIRFNFIMRDVRNAAIFTDPAFLQAQNAFKIFEKGVEIEPTETNKFVVGWEKLKVNLVLMLDLSGSMQSAAVQAGLAGPEPLLKLYRDTCTPFLQSLPAHWQVSLMEFHDRGKMSTVHGFTLDHDAIAQALQDLHVQDYGATELLPAISSGAAELQTEDADVSAVIVISDGRRTTPPGDVDELADFLHDKAWTRVYSVGWGDDIEHEPLARLASKTGGHYYSTRTDANGLPQASELDRVLPMLSSDLRAYRMLGYTTLNEEDDMTVRVTGFFNIPGDNPDRGFVQGSFAQQLKPGDVKGHPAEGLIAMHSTGINPDGTAVVYISSDYVPRNVNKFAFNVTATEDFTLVPTPADENGLCEGWPLEHTNGTDYYRLDSPGGVLPYGIFGDLVQLTFTGITEGFDVNLSYDNSIYQPDLEPKTFVFPPTLHVEVGKPTSVSGIPTP